MFAVRAGRLRRQQGRDRLWIEDLFARDAAPPVRFTAEGMNVNSPAFSPDGRTVYFLSAKSGSMQLWSQPVAGGEAVQVSDYPLDVGSYKLSPDGKRVALSLRGVHRLRRPRLHEAAARRGRRRQGLAA